MNWRSFFPVTICLGLLMVSSWAVADELLPKLFTADFNHPNSGFSENYPWEVAGGELRYGGGDPQYDCDYNFFDQPVSPDFQYEIRAAWQGGDTEAGFGVLFRIADNQGMMALEINHQGHFRYSYMNKGCAITLEDWQQSDAIKPDGINKLKMIGHGKLVKCYINDVLVLNDSGVGDIDEAAFRKPVKVGVIVYSGVKCAFDDFRLQELPAKEK